MSEWPVDAVEMSRERSRENERERWRRREEVWMRAGLSGFYLKRLEVLGFQRKFRRVLPFKFSRSTRSKCRNPKPDQVNVENIRKTNLLLRAWTTCLRSSL